jgi:hypothetical protein
LIRSAHHISRNIFKPFNHLQKCSVDTRCFLDMGGIYIQISRRDLIRGCGDCARFSADIF